MTVGGDNVRDGVPVDERVALRASSLGRLRLPMFPRNQMHSSSLWVLRFPKMYVTTLGYKGKILH